MRPSIVTQNDQIINSQKILLTSTIQFDNDRWDDGLNTEADRGKFHI